MRYTYAKKLNINDFVWVPEARSNGRITEIQKDSQSNDLFFRISIDNNSTCQLYHHTAIQPFKSVDEVVDFFLNDPKTQVFVNYNDELAEWLYSIEVVDSGAFWLCSFKTEEEALQYIREHNLSIVNPGK